MSQASFRRKVPYAERAYCFLDLEGTGTKPGFHEITEIGIKHTELGQYHRIVKPRFLERAEPKALQVSGYNSKDWAGSQFFEDLQEELRPYITDCTIIGHNIWNYDIPMLRGQYEMAGVTDHEEWMSRDIIDTQILARAVLVREGMKNISMRACRKFFGRGYEGAHNALEDCFFNQDLFDDIMGRVSFKPIQPKQENLF